LPSISQGDPYGVPDGQHDGGDDVEAMTWDGDDVGMMARE
jgi:hypothetical protein